MNQKTYIFHSKNYSSLTRVTMLKVAVNMTDSTCLIGDISYSVDCAFLNLDVLCHKSCALKLIFTFVSVHCRK